VGTGCRKNEARDIEVGIRQFVLRRLRRQGVCAMAHAGRVLACQDGSLAAVRFGFLRDMSGSNRSVLQI
jgi:hypothetical protein